MLGEIVRVTSEHAREQYIGMTGQVTTVRQGPDGGYTIQVLSDGDADGKGCQVMAMPMQ